MEKKKGREREIKRVKEKHNNAQRNKEKPAQKPPL
jgi:hypothetical protein